MPEKYGHSNATTISEQIKIAKRIAGEKSIRPVSGGLVHEAFQSLESLCEKGFAVRKTGTHQGTKWSYEYYEMTPEGVDVLVEDTAKHPKSK